MIHVTIDCDLSACCLEAAYEELLKFTQEAPIGIMIGENDKATLTEILSLEDYAKWGLRVYVIESFPLDMWILYNSKDAIYSDSA